VASLLEVGTGFHPELTGRENVYLNGAVLGMSRAEIRRKFDEIVAFAEVEKFLDTPVKHYSSGMYVRLAFAVAAHLEPEILIVDEVLAVGDAQFQKRCLGKMGDVARDGRTVLFVSHQLGMVRQLCSKCMLLEQGELTVSGQVGRVLDAYLDNATVQRHLLFHKHLAGVEISPLKHPAEVTFASDLVLRLRLRSLPQHALGVNLSFRNESGRRISLFSTDPHDGFSLPRASELTLLFKMPSCRFAPGAYTVDVTITDPAVAIVEELPDCMRLAVLPCAIGGHWPYDACFGDVFPEHHWQIESWR
jgi:lipopolysaccharide transport system ATP-binding protein